MMTEPEYQAAYAAYESASKVADDAYRRIAETEAAQKAAEAAWSDEWDLVAPWARRLGSNWGVENDARVRELREAADAAEAERERAFEEWRRLFGEAQRLEAVVTDEDERRIAATIAAETGADA